MAKKKRGKLLDKKDLYISIHVGDAKDADGNEYTMATMVDSSPVVTNEKTGKRFNLPWQDIIEMSVESGIDK